MLLNVWFSVVADVLRKMIDLSAKKPTLQKNTEIVKRTKMSLSCI